MNRFDRRSVLLGVGALAIGGCAPGARVSDGNGAGGGGAGGGGAGGNGAGGNGAGGARKTPRGGIGGTGIVGTLTDFGSLLVNGLVVETGARTRVTDAFRARDLSALAIGQSLTVEAESAPLFGSDTADAVYEAIRVHISHPVIGLVTDVGPAGQTARVAGVRVVREPGALGRFVPGTRMAVSGLWRGREVVASRVEPAAAGPDVLAGELGADGRSIGGLALVPGNAALPGAGTFATVFGRSGPSGFAVEQVTPGRFTGVAGALVSLSVEGYLEPIAKAPGFAISGLGHSFDEAASLRALAADRAVFRGGYDGSFVVEDGLVLPEGLSERRRLLAGVTRGDLPGKVRSARP